MQSSSPIRRRAAWLRVAFVRLTLILNLAIPCLLAQTTWDCGGEGERPCGSGTDFFWENGNLFADRGLAATGFRVLPTIQFNASDWINLNRADMEMAADLVNNRLPALKARLSGLGVEHFLEQKCLGTVKDGDCWLIPPTPLTPGVPSLESWVPDFSRSGWNVHREIAEVMDLAARALRQFPSSIRGIPGNIPAPQFPTPSVDAVMDIDSFTESLNGLKNFFSSNARFFNVFTDLVHDFTDPPSTALCINATRRQEIPNAFRSTWVAWALKNQRELGKYEPFNWASTLGTHNAFNNTADGYIAPNQHWSITDQLNLGSRWISLDIHWFEGKLRLSHATSDHGGASPRDRFYANAIKEIAAWVRAHPDEFVIIAFEDRSDGHDLEVTEPLERYLGDLIYRVRELSRPWRSGEYDPIGQWPSLQELREAGKQVIVLGDESNHNSDLIWSHTPEVSFSASRAKEFKPDPTNHVAFAADERIGPFDNINLGTQYETRSFLDPFDPSGYLTAVDVADRVRYAISEVSMDMLHAQEHTAQCPKPEICEAPDQRIAAMIWSWAPGQPEDALGGPDNGQDAALLNGDSGRWESRSPDEVHFFACARKRGLDSVDLPDRLGEVWKVTARSGPWWEGDLACDELNRTLRTNQIDDDGDGSIDEEDEGDFNFLVPINGTQNERLLRALRQFRQDRGLPQANVWLSYHDRLTPGKWMINRSFPMMESPGGGGVLALDGVDDFVKIPGFGGVSPMDEVTVEFWQKAEEAREQVTLDLNGRISTNRITVHAPWVDGNVYWDCGNINAGGRLIYRPPVPITGRWQHFAMVASRSGNYMKIYRNGVEEASKTGMTPHFRMGGGDLLLGASALDDRFVAHFRGQIDEVRVWMTARTESQIRSSLTRRLYLPQNNLRAYLRLDHAPGDSVTNVAFSLQGVRMNGAQWAGSDVPRNERWRDAVLSASPILYHRLDEKTNSYWAVDSSRRALHGYYDQVTLDRPSPATLAGTGAAFPAPGSAVVLRSLGSYTQFTLSLWLRPENIANPQAILACHDDSGSDAGLNISLEPGGDLALDFAGNSPRRVVVPQAFETPGSWYHLVIVYNLRPLDNRLQVFINGAPRGPISTGIARAVRFESPRLGNRKDGGRAFSGDLDEFALFDRPLSAAEIGTLWNSSLLETPLTMVQSPAGFRISWPARLSATPIYTTDKLDAGSAAWLRVDTQPQIDGERAWIEVNRDVPYRFYKLLVEP